MLRGLGFSGAVLEVSGYR